jgi:hypothetical protein
MFFNKLKYRFFPLSSSEPRGSKIPVFTLVSFAIDFIIAGLN